MSRPPFSAASLASLDLDPAPIRPEWVLQGQPVARCRHWSDSSDGTTSAIFQPFSVPTSMYSMKRRM